MIKRSSLYCVARQTDRQTRTHLDRQTETQTVGVSDVSLFTHDDDVTCLDGSVSLRPVVELRETVGMKLRVSRDVKFHVGLHV